MLQVVAFVGSRLNPLFVLSQPRNLLTRHLFADFEHFQKIQKTSTKKGNWRASNCPLESHTTTRALTPAAHTCIERWVYRDFEPLNLAHVQRRERPRCCTHRRAAHHRRPWHKPRPDRCLYGHSQWHGRCLGSLWQQLHSSPGGAAR